MAPKPTAKPSPYPSLPFHILRALQLLSSLIVIGIVSYFLKELRQEHFKLPSTFLLLLATALITLLTLLTTTTLHTMSPPSPLLNLTLNAVLILLWTPSFALLAYSSSSTLLHICNQANWDNLTGIAICKLYKALFSFTFFGLIYTCLALGLDVRALRKMGRRGTFTALERNAGKRGFERPWEVQQTNPNPSVRGPGSRGGEGYTVPEEQFSYEDTRYHGGVGRAE